MAHPIESIMRTTMENLKDMIDVNTVVGEAVTSGDGITIIPISKVSFGFVAGGGEYGLGPAQPPKTPIAGIDALPFGGGTGAGVSVCPVGFLIVGGGQVRMLPATYNTPIERIVELVPQLVGDVRDMLEKKKSDDGGSTGPEDYPPYGI